MKRLIKTFIAILTLVGTATANSTAHYAGEGLDYYWVPGNSLLFHVNYPYDFLIYFFACVGFVTTLAVGYWIVKDWWKEHMVG